jgi:hypothetical protein
MSSPPIHRARLLRAHDRYLLFFLHLLWFPEHHVVWYVSSIVAYKSVPNAQVDLYLREKLSKIHAIFIFYLYG